MVKYYCDKCGENCGKIHYRVAMAQYSSEVESYETLVMSGSDKWVLCSACFNMIKGILND